MKPKELFKEFFQYVTLNILEMLGMGGATKYSILITSFFSYRAM